MCHLAFLTEGKGPHYSKRTNHAVFCTFTYPMYSLVRMDPHQVEEVNVFIVMTSYFFQLLYSGGGRSHVWFADGYNSASTRKFDIPTCKLCKQH